METERVINFGAGPATLPMDVLQQARDELLDWTGTGMSVMEVSHRSSEFKCLAESIEADLRELLAIPPDYSVLLLQGGASAQFAMVPLNLTGSGMQADYIVTGHWSLKGYKEAQRLGCGRCATSEEIAGLYAIPEPQSWILAADAAYVYYTSNETISGVEFQDAPDVGVTPLVCDMTSNFLTRPVDISRHGLVFAGAQKNFGPAGLTVVIVHGDLLGRPRPDIPTLCDYSVHANAGSLQNTPPTFSWYVAGLTLDWIKRQGGIKEMEQRSIRRSTLLYTAIDQSDFYSNPVQPEYRSRVNVPFTLSDSSQDQRFLDEAKAHGLAALKGHRSVGGMRASLYNAMPEAGVATLIDFMGDFARRYG